MESKYSIKDLERLTGVKAHTIRIWEQRYNVVCPARTDTNIRTYCDNDLRRLLNVSVLVHGGMKISKVALLSDAQRNALVLDASKYSGTYENQVNGLKLAMLDFDEIMFDRILTNCIAKYGSEETFSKIIGAFIEEIGLLWQTDTIGLVHEHFATNLIKQKLYSVLDGAYSIQNTPDSKTFVLYLPSDELHELGLLYLNYILKSAGHRVVYLGQSVPLEYLPQVVKQVKADALVSIFTTQPSMEDLPSYFNAVSSYAEFDDVKWYLCGLQLLDFDKNGLDSKFVFGNNVPALKDLLLR